MEQDFQTLTLGDGVALHVMPTDKFKTTTVQLFLRQPLKAETAATTAVIPFVLRRGTERFPTARDVHRHMEQLYGAQFSAGVGKLGETQHVELYMQVTHDKFLPEPVGLVEAAVDFLAEALFRPVREGGVFKAEYVEQEAASLQRRLARMINQPPQYALNRLREEMYRDEPFGLHRYGTKDALEKVAPGLLYDRYRTVLATSPVDVFVVGPVEPVGMADVLRERLAFPREDVADVPPLTGDGGAPEEPRVVVEEQPVQQGVLTFGFRTGIRYPDEDYPALLVYNGILGGYTHSKLFVNVREKASLAYFASSQLEGTKGMLVVAAGIAVDKYEQALAIVQQQLDALAAGDITDDELEQTKKALVNDFLSGRDSPGRIIGSRRLGIVNGRVRDFRDTIAAVQAVTKADVQRVAASVQPDTVYFLRSPKTD